MYDGWHERVVKIGDDDRFAFAHARDTIPLFEQMQPPGVRDAQIGDVFEWRADQIAPSSAAVSHARKGPPW